MKKIAGLVFIIFLFSFSILADMAPPPVGEQIQIVLKQNYPEYQFYIASYDLKVVPDPKPVHISRPNMVVNIPESFKLRQIDLSVENPFVEAITSARIENRGTLVGKDLWLIAVKKTLGSDVESKVKEVIDARTKIDGIYVGYLTQAEETSKGGMKVIVNTVTKFDKNELEIQVSEGTAKSLSSNSTGKTADKTKNCIGLGLILTGLAFVGMWWTRKRVVLVVKQN